jgi:2,4-dienoyl-CoA reductase-like NADH-dependent reductase (Old Yellow Enzyme family)
MEEQESLRSLRTIAEPLTLPCGLTLPNRLVKCPMQETLAQAPLFDPPVATFSNLYRKWATSQYGLIITGQVQVDIRFLSVAGDVVTHAQSLEGKHFEAWKEWAKISRQDGTPCIVQLAHPGRMSAKGAGIRPDDMRTLCPSEVPVKLGESYLDKLVSGQNKHTQDYSS